jgi:hypothetical protein
MIKANWPRPAAMLALALSIMMAGGPALQAQAPAASAPPRPSGPPTLKILVLEGRMAVNRPRLQLHVPPVVEVRDSNDRLVEGASVLFTVPDGGATGSFPGGARTMTVVTNTQGQAQATGFTGNDTEGRFEVSVEATWMNQYGRTSFPMANSLSMVAEAAKKPLYKNKWVLLGAGGAVAGIVTAVLLSGGSSGTTVSVTPGAVSVGAR